MPERSLHSRRLRACLLLSLTYLLVALFLLAVLLAASFLGVELWPWQLDALWLALAIHGLGVLVLSGLIAVSNRGSRITQWHSKMSLAAMPFLFLVSLDRIAAVSFPPTPKESILQAHPVRGWTSRPGWVEPRGDRLVRINHKGLRGPEIAYDKPANKPRIVFLGDSLTFGVGVDYNEVFVEQVARLAEQDTCAPKVTVINCSATAYSPWQEYDLLRSECLKYRPDLVVQVFCLNDVFEKFQLQRFGGPTRGLAPAVPSPLEWSGLYRLTHSLFVTLCRPGQAELARIKQVYSVRGLIERSETPEIREAWRITLENMGKIHSLTRDHGVPLAIVCFPFAEQLSPYAPEVSPPQQELAAFAKEAGIPFLDLLPLYRRYCRQERVRRATGRRWEGLAILPDRIHPTPEGHRLAAEAIYAFLVERDLIRCGR